MTVAVQEPEAGLVRRIFRQVVRSLVAKQRNDTGVMVALFLPPDVAAELAVPGGEPANVLHLTLRIFADDAAQVPIEKLDKWAAEIEQVAKRTPVLSGRISGVGRFNGDQAGGEDVVYATIDLPGLEQLRDQVRWCGDYRELGESDEPEHGFSPHVTLAYGNDVELPEVPTVPVRIDRLSLAIGNERRDYMFAGAATAPVAVTQHKAQWSAAFINDLPDSSFLYIEAGGEKDGDGRTTPRSLRHFPVKGPDGAVDLPHVRNALARIPQSKLPADVQAAAERKARAMLEAATEKASVERSEAVVATLGELGWEGKVEVEPVGVSEDGSALIWKADREEGPGLILVDDGASILELSAWVERASVPALEPVEQFAVIKSEGDLRYTLGVAYPARRTTKATDSKDVDAHKDYMTPEELEKAAWAYLRDRTTVRASGGSTGVGTMHEDGTDGAGDVVESYIYRGPTWKVADQVVEAGDWLLGVVWDEPTWARIQSGDLTGYSMQGYAAREPG